MTTDEITKRGFEAYPKDYIDSGLNPGLHIDRNNSKREGYTRALTEIEELPKIKGWVARGEDGRAIWDEKPTLVQGVFFIPGNSNYFNLDDNLLPEIQVGDDPIEVELIIRPVNSK